MAGGSSNGTTDSAADALTAAGGDATSPDSLAVFNALRGGYNPFQGRSEGAYNPFRSSARPGSGTETPAPAGPSLADQYASYTGGYQAKAEAAKAAQIEAARLAHERYMAQQAAAAAAAAKASAFQPGGWYNDPIQFIGGGNDINNWAAQSAWQEKNPWMQSVVSNYQNQYNPFYANNMNGGGKEGGLADLYEGFKR